MIWHFLISESVSVHGRYVVGLSSVWVRDCRSAVGYDSSIVLMIGFQSVFMSVIYIGPISGDSIPNLTRNDPDMNPTGFTMSSATLSVADSWPIHWKLCGFCRFRVGLAGVTGVLGNQTITAPFTNYQWQGQIPRSWPHWKSIDTLGGKWMNARNTMMIMAEATGLHDIATTVLGNCSCIELVTS